jgi:hypothetical protein
VVGIKAVGLVDGCPVGAKDGVLVRVIVGFEVVGDNVGVAVGCIVGRILGEEVGAFVVTVTVVVEFQLTSHAFNLPTLDSNVSLAKVPLISAAAVSFWRIFTKLQSSIAIFVVF